MSKNYAFAGLSDSSLSKSNCNSNILSKSNCNSNSVSKSNRAGAIAIMNVTQTSFGG